MLYCSKAESIKLKDKLKPIMDLCVYIFKRDAIVI